MSQKFNLFAEGFFGSFKLAANIIIAIASTISAFALHGQSNEGLGVNTESKKPANG